MNETRQALATRFWLERLGYLPDRSEKAKVFAALIDQEGLNLHQVGALAGLSSQRVSRILRDEGVKPQRLRPGRPVIIGVDRGAYTVSQRLLEALKQFPDRAEALREGLAFFQQQPEKLVLETIGVSEKSATCSLALTPDDLALIAALGVRLGYHNQSAVIRNCIEFLIDRYHLEGYRKPSDWRSRPLSLKQGGARGRNPNPALRQGVVSKTVPIPLSLWQRLEAYRAASSAFVLAAFVRAAIDQANLVNLQPLTAVEPPEPLISRSLRIFAAQRTWLQQQLVATGFESENDLLLALIKQHADRCDRSGDASQRENQDTHPK